MKIRLLESQIIGNELYERGENCPRADEEVDEVAQRVLISQAKAVELDVDGNVIIPEPVAAPVAEEPAAPADEEPNH